jgi:hypothetical protein
MSQHSWKAGQQQKHKRISPMSDVKTIRAFTYDGMPSALMKMSERGSGNGGTEPGTKSAAMPPTGPPGSPPPSTPPPPPPEK